MFPVSSPNLSIFSHLSFDPVPPGIAEYIIQSGIDSLDFPLQIQFPAASLLYPDHVYVMTTIEIRISGYEIDVYDINSGHSVYENNINGQERPARALPVSGQIYPENPWLNTPVAGSMAILFNGVNAGRFYLYTNGNWAIVPIIDHPIYPQYYDPGYEPMAQYLEFVYNCSGISDYLIQEGISSINIPMNIMFPASMPMGFVYVEVHSNIDIDGTDVNVLYENFPSIWEFITPQCVMRRAQAINASGSL